MLHSTTCITLQGNIRSTSRLLWNCRLKLFWHWKIDCCISYGRLFWNLQKIELRFSKSGKPLLFWIFWFVSVVVCQILVVWIKFYGKFMFSRRWPLETSESLNNFIQTFMLMQIAIILNTFCALQSRFLELSWCEALSLKFARSYYVDFSVNS